VTPADSIGPVSPTRESDAAVSPRPRIPPVERFDDAQRDALDKTLAGPDGLPLNIFKTLAQEPKLLRRVNSLGGYFVVHGSIPVREREIVILRTASRTRSAYELAHHRRLAVDAGLRAEEIEAAIDPRSPHAWAPADRALLRLTDELIEDDTVSDETWNALPQAWGHVSRLELLVLVGYYRMLAGVLNAVGVEVDA
jgi:4-carboxymuconolactone decarboxylase